MIIYKATNKINGKIYIGQTVLSLDKRINDHYREAKNSKNDTTYFHNALRKYKVGDFVWEILEDNISTIEELNEKEIYYIALFNSTDKNIGYNLKAGGNGGGINSESTKRKIGITTKKKWQNPEIAKRMRNGLQKGAETMKQKAKNNYKNTNCKQCGKLIVYRPMDVACTPNFCCKECFTSYMKNNNKGFIIANQVNKIKREEKDLLTKNNVVNWLRNNGELLTNVKYNSLQGIFTELKKITGLCDARSIMRPFNITSRKEFVVELSKIYAELTGNCKN